MAEARRFSYSLRRYHVLGILTRRLMCTQYRRQVFSREVELSSEMNTPRSVAHVSYSVCVFSMQWQCRGYRKYSVWEFYCLIVGLAHRLDVTFDFVFTGMTNVIDDDKIPTTPRRSTSLRLSVDYVQPPSQSGLMSFDVLKGLTLAPLPILNDVVVNHQGSHDAWATWAAFWAAFWAATAQLRCKPC